MAKHSRSEDWKIKDGTLLLNGEPVPVSPDVVRIVLRRMDMNEAYEGPVLRALVRRILKLERRITLDQLAQHLRGVA